MRTSFILAVPFLAVALAQSTDSAVSQISDGQPQASYSNGFTSYLTETNSLGVVTGQPTVVTSQPSVATSQTVAVTSQTTPVTFISGSPGIPNLPTTTATGSIPVVASAPPIVSVGTTSFLTVGANTTVTTAASPSTSGSGSSGSASGSSGASVTSGGTSPSGTAGAAASPSSSSTSGAAIIQPVLGLGLVGAIFTAFL